MKKAILVLLFALQIFQAKSQQNFTLRLDSLMKAYQKLNWNATILVGNRNQIIYQKSIGYADVKNKIALQPNAIVQSASVGKMFTSTRIMQLLQEKKIDLNTTVNNYLPEWNIKNLDKITIHHLLTHTAGLGSPWDHPRYDFQKNYNEKELKNLIEQVPLVFNNPGERNSYSNIAYVLLGKIISKFDNMPYEKSIAEKIFYPSGINYPIKKSKNTQIAVPHYQISSDQFAIDPEMTIKQLRPGNGAGGWMLSGIDLYKFLKGYINGIYLNKEFIQLQLTANHTYNALEKEFRYGVYLLDLKSPNAPLIFGHNGGGKGFSTDAYVDPESGFIVIMCSNQYGSGYSITENVFKILNNQNPVYPDHSEPIRVVNNLELKGNNYLINNPKQFFDELNIDPSEFLLNVVYENLKLSKNYDGAAAIVTAGRGLLPQAASLWVCSGDIAIKLNQNNYAREYYMTAKRLSVANKDDILVKQIEEKLKRI